MIMNLYGVPEGPNNGQRLREACRIYSESNPDVLVVGFNCFNRFPMMETADTITADHVRNTDLGGYWKAGQFQLFSAGELALLDREDDEDEPDCTCNLQKGTEFEGYHHPECDAFNGHN